MRVVLSKSSAGAASQKSFSPTVARSRQRLSRARCQARSVGVTKHSLTSCFFRCDGAAREAEFPLQVSGQLGCGEGRRRIWG